MDRQEEYPRWVGPTEQDFDRATWQFEGTRMQALFDLRAEQPKVN